MNFNQIEALAYELNIRKYWSLNFIQRGTMIILGNFVRMSLICLFKDFISYENFNNLPKKRLLLQVVRISKINTDQFLI